MISRLTLLRWCLKEAAYKSLSTHVHPHWTGFQLVSSPHQPPAISMTDRVKWRNSSRLTAGDVEMMCSLSNDAGVVVGVVVAMTK